MINITYRNTINQLSNPTIMLIPLVSTDQVWNAALSSNLIWSSRVSRLDKYSKST
ncbi:hypothetical protein IMSAG192_00956 [Muribaculaceae bacterium]|nr:hypothetical protein IMSAG192_00956 [Muribaculaceae bacterium]